MKILLSPLDWGLGHATRLIPIIRYLLSKEIEVHIAASGKGLDVLKKNFSQNEVIFHTLTNLNIQYSKKGKNFIWKLLVQFPSLWLKKKKDSDIIRTLHARLQFDVIISDNRYGVYAKDAYTIFITHQLQVITGMNEHTDRKLLQYHSRLFERYDEIWVPDHFNQENAIAPKLSHPEKRVHKNIYYIGHLTQFQVSNLNSSEKNENRILVLLSGPEPARSLLLEQILQQANDLPQYHFTIIAGSPLEKKYHLPSHIHMEGLLSETEIEAAIQGCELIICRSGYSTIMDLMALDKKALLIPTPGQTEQEYIAEVLSNKKMYFSIKQEHLNLSYAIPQAFTFNGFTTNYKVEVNEHFKSRVDEVLHLIQKRKKQ